MHKTLLLSALLSALLFAEEAPKNTPEEPKKLETVEPVVVKPIVVQPVVVTPAPAPAPKFSKYFLLLAITAGCSVNAR